MATNLRLANLLIAIASVTGGLPYGALAQTQSANDARKPQSPDEAIEFLIRAVRKGSDADVDALLPDTFVDAFQKARTAARAKTKACERLAEAIKQRSFGKEGEDLANALLGPSRFDLWTEWKTVKIIERNKRNDGRVLLVLYIEWTKPGRPPFAVTQFLCEKASDGWRLLPIRAEPQNEKELAEELPKMKTEKQTIDQETAGIDKLADDVTEGKLKNAHQVKKALLQIEPTAREYGKYARRQRPKQ